MAEGARLEIVCAFTRTVGSNPTLSAKHSLAVALGSEGGIRYSSVGLDARADSERIPLLLNSANRCWGHRVASLALRWLGRGRSSSFSA